MINNHFFKLVSLIKKTHFKPEPYNLFTVLRSSSDEVRLHSRFLKSLMDPKEAHTCGNKLLNELLPILKVEGFKLSNIEVVNEYKDIDIFVKNDKKQAIIIENKIYAGDQYNQLNRYFKTAIKEGIKSENLWVFYLTLNGHEPEDQSIKGIPKEFISSNRYGYISYEYHIKLWLKQCMKHVSLIPSVRESISQYNSVISNLSGTNQSEQYMEELKDLLLNENNMLYVNDIKQAYIENLIDLQLLFWNELIDYQKENYPEFGEISEDSILNHENPRGVISNYFHSSRNNKYYGLYFSLPNSAAYIAIEIEHQMYIGVWCEKSKNQKEHKALSAKLRETLSGNTSNWWPIWRYTSDGINFKSPNNASVEVLVNKEKRAQVVSSMMKELYSFWKEATSMNDKI